MYLPINILAQGWSEVTLERKQRQKTTSVEPHQQKLPTYTN